MSFAGVLFFRGFCFVSKQVPTFPVIASCSDFLEALGEFLNPFQGTGCAAGVGFGHSGPAIDRRIIGGPHAACCLMFSASSDTDFTVPTIEWQEKDPGVSWVRKVRP